MAIFFVKQTHIVFRNYLYKFKKNMNYNLKFFVRITTEQKDSETNDIGNRHTQFSKIVCINSKTNMM